MNFLEICGIIFLSVIAVYGLFVMFVYSIIGWNTYKTRPKREREIEIIERYP